MARVEVLLPQFGMGMQDGDIARWLVAAGERVTAGQPLVEVEAAKTTVEVEAPATGTVAELLVAEGATVAVRAAIAIIETD